MLWGVNPRFKWVLKQLPSSTVFLYVTKGEGVSGGLALYGIAREVIDLEEPYWPEGAWEKAFYLEVKATAPGVLENPENPTSWRLISREKLKAKGIIVLPGPQKLEEEIAQLLKQMLEIAFDCSA